jgi:hypothetical protein
VHLGSSGLQEKDLVCPRMSMSIDFLSGGKISRPEYQVRGTAILRINL